MGGMGSGRRWHSGSKETTDNYRILDIRRWQRDSLLEPGRTFGWQWSRNGESIASITVTTERDRVILKYRHKRGDEEWRDERYPVYLSWTPCSYGGARAWFVCPAQRCTRRVAILYGGAIFACRHCYDLAYPSQRENSSDRAARKAEKIRKRLGWEGGILSNSGEKPKGMHWRTFHKLTRENDTSVNSALIGIAERFGFLHKILDDLNDR